MKIKFTRMILLSLGLNYAGAALAADAPAPFASPAVSAEKQPIDVDGGFEHCQSSDTSKWEFFGPIPSKTLVSTEKPHSGTYAMRIPVSAEIAGKITGAHQALSPSLFKPGDVVTMSGYIRHKSPFENGNAIGSFAFQIFGSNGKPLVFTATRPQDRPGEWQLCTERVVVPQNFTPDCTVKVIACVQISDAPAQQNEIFFDDISLSIERGVSQQQK